MEQITKEEIEVFNTFTETLMSWLKRNTEDTSAIYITHNEAKLFIEGIHKKSRTKR